MVSGGGPHWCLGEAGASLLLSGIRLSSRFTTALSADGAVGLPH